MTGHATEVDEATGLVVLAFPVGSAAEVPGWAAVLRESSTEADSWDGFVSRLDTVAADSGWADSAVATFVRVAADNGGMDVIVRLVGLEDELPELYTYLTAGPFGWVLDDHRAYLQGLWAAEWPDRLTVELDVRWGAGWQEHPAEHKASWLADLVADGALADEFGWVPPEHHDALAHRWGAGWRGPLSSDLDARWGAGWQQHPDEHKAAWLTDLLAVPALAEDQPAGDEPAEEEPAQDAPAMDEPTPSKALSQDEAVDEVIEMAMALPGFAELTDEEAADIIADAIEKARS